MLPTRFWAKAYHQNWTPRVDMVCQQPARNVACCGIHEPGTLKRLEIWPFSWVPDEFDARKHGSTHEAIVDIGPYFGVIASHMQ
jgi:hypothetical protein